MIYKIIGKYVKELDFKIPNPKTFYLLSKEISNYKINIDIKSNQVKQKIIEVETTLSLLRASDDSEKINTKIIYSTIIELLKEIDDKKEIEKIVLIKVPEQIFPELRKYLYSYLNNLGLKILK